MNPETLNPHPVFQPNQILRDTDLNELFKYLNQQTRLSRISLGFGIRCGLIPSWKSEGGESLSISAGFGVTSEGLLIPNTEPLEVKNCIPTTLKRSALGGQGDDIDAFVLDESGAKPLDSGFVKSKVVVTRIKIEDKIEDRYPEDDDKGKLRKFEVVHYLIHEADALEILQDNYGTDDLESLFHNKFQLPELYLDRFGYDAGNGVVNLQSISTYDQFLARYRSNIASVKPRVGDAIENAHKIFSRIFSGFFSVSPLSADFPDPDQDLFVQYYYDHLSDMIMAYDEFRHVAFDLMDMCVPDAKWFPSHLFLGPVVMDGLPTPPALSRTPCFQPPVFNGNQIRVEAARMLFERLENLIRDFKIPPVSDRDAIRITPSKYGDAPLSERAIAYYYDPENNPHEYWNTELHRKNTSHRKHSYHRVKTPGASPENPPFDDPLVYDFEAQNFFRIEGHIGLKLDDAVERIHKLRGEYNLPFKIVTVVLDEEDSEHPAFGQFAGRHPGMEHKAGVPRDGTFIVVASKSDAGELLVVADFCLPYRSQFEQVNPTISLDQTSYCSDDQEQYIVTTSPAGGMLNGPGIQQETSTFAPAKTGTKDGEIVVTYSVGGVTVALLITILPVPEVKFTMPAEVSDNVELTATPAGGEFTTDIDPGIPHLGILESQGDVFFEPSQGGVPKDTPIKITYRFVHENGCDAEVTQTTKVVEP